MKHYGRYVDDTFYVSTDKAWLMSLVPRIDRSAAALAHEDVRERLMAQANSMLGILSHTRSYNLRCDLFGSYPMFHIADGMRGMKKFRLSKHDKRYK